MSQLIKAIIQIQNWSKGIETMLLTSLDQFKKFAKGFINCDIYNRTLNL